MEIKLINGRWCVNGKTLKDLTPNETIILDKFIKECAFIKKTKSKNN